MILEQSVFSNTIKLLFIYNIYCSLLWGIKGLPYLPPQLTRGHLSIRNKPGIWSLETTSKKERKSARKQSPAIILTEISSNCMANLSKIFNQDNLIKHENEKHHSHLRFTQYLTTALKISCLCDIKIEGLRFHQITFKCVYSKSVACLFGLLCFALALI